jgi:hypothetical protein
MPALKVADDNPKGTFTSAAAEAGNGAEMEDTAGDGCTSEGSAGVDERDEEQEGEISWFSAGSTRSL